MRKITLSLVLTVLVIWVVEAQDKPVVVATASMIADMASEIFGDKAEVRSIVDIGKDPHTHEPTPGDAQLVNGAAVVLQNGLTFEGWLSELIENSGTKAAVHTVTEGVEVIKSEGYSAEDPHAWMDARNAIIYSQNILAAANELLPAESEYFNQRFADYKLRLEALDSLVEVSILSIPEKQRVLITSHDAFQYYGKRYGIRLESAMGTSTEAEAKTSDLTALSKAIDETGVPAIFVESTINPQLIQQLAKDKGITVGGELYADSIGEKGGEAGTYIDMMKYNTRSIVEALSATPEPLAKEENASSGTPTPLMWVLLGLLIVATIFVWVRRRKQMRDDDGE